MASYLRLDSGFDEDLRLKIALVDKNSRINQSDQNHWWYPAW